MTAKQIDAGLKNGKKLRGFQTLVGWLGGGNGEQGSLDAADEVVDVFVSFRPAQLSDRAHAIPIGEVIDCGDDGLLGREQQKNTRVDCWGCKVLLIAFVSGAAAAARCSRFFSVAKQS